MRLTVLEKTADPDIGCIFCDAKSDEANYTLIMFDDDQEVICMCPEHLDKLISCALQRHKKAISGGDPFWYLTPDSDPWEAAGAGAE